LLPLRLMAAHRLRDRAAGSFPASRTDEAYVRLLLPGRRVRPFRAALILPLQMPAREQTEYVCGQLVRILQFVQLRKSAAQRLQIVAPANAAAPPLLQPHRAAHYLGDRFLG